MNKQTLIILFLIIFFSLIVRLIQMNFPALTSDEARVAYRGYTLATSGKDELGRSLPLLFNSLTDYQLPAVSYITALGETVFGKTNFGMRAPFIVFGVILIILTYKIAKLFNNKKTFWITSTLVLVFSPALIFLSKIPNDSITLACLVTLLFYLLARNKSNIILIILVIILSLTISKFAWFIVPPFVIFTLLFYQNNFSRKIKIMLSVFSLALVLVIVGFYLQVPQTRRSLSENNFSIFSSTTVKNGINRLRGEGIKERWPNYLEIILFNKTDFMIIGFMHWLSNLQPSIYFGQFAKSGNLNFSQMGALNKILIVPFVWGVMYLVCRGKKKEKLLPAYFIILTFPALFIYPDFSQGLIVLTLPFVALVTAFGFMQFNRTISLGILLLMILEVGLNLIYLTPEKRNTNFLRPFWIQGITKEVYNQSLSYKVAISDDIVDDVISFTEWYNPVVHYVGYSNVVYPYKFHQSELKNIKIIGSDRQPYLCKETTFDRAFISKRDKDKIRDSDIKIIKTYYDGSGQEVVYFLEKGLCLK